MKEIGLLGEKILDSEFNLEIKIQESAGAFVCGEETALVLSSDMMSDVLAYAKPGALMITGLTSSQSVRTADFADAAAVLYIRGKRPDENTMQLAEQLAIPLLSTELGMFDVCGVLYSEGLRGIC